MLVGVVVKAVVKQENADATISNFNSCSVSVVGLFMTIITKKFYHCTWRVLFLAVMGRSEPKAPLYRQNMKAHTFSREF